MIKALFAGLIAATLFAAPASAQQNFKSSKYREVVNNMLAEKAIRARNVDRMAVEPVVEGTEGSPVTGAVAWVYLDRCADGYLVVRMDISGAVHQAYTRNGCRVEGVDMY